jgi:[protein-PII] uridylyltransferase
VHDWERPLASIWSELEAPELLLLALLFHDVGKGVPGQDHVVAGLQAAESVFRRLSLEADEADTARFLIGEHLLMSANLQRRDIFDPETIRAFAERVGSNERLKMLTLFTYADIRAVNPEALTPWKAESLFQFYVSTALPKPARRWRNISKGFRAGTYLPIRRKRSPSSSTWPRN